MSDQTHSTPEEAVVYGETSSLNDEARPLWSSISRGFSSKCPKCGDGNLFSSSLKVADNCHSCGEEFHHHRADDLPAYLNIFVVGHVVVGLMVGAMAFNLLGMWSLMAVCLALTILLAALLMRPFKGAVVGAQWALQMHGFGGEDDFSNQ